jgi:hypothetical protein
VHRFRRRHGSTVARTLGTVVALALALIVQACGSASASGTIKTRFFGVHVPDLATAFPSSLDATVGAVDLTTNGVYWPDLETSDGVWDWTRLDSLVDQSHAHGAQPLLVLGQTPSWAAGGSAAAVPPMTAWKDYVRQAVRQYGTRVDYEIWPEPNIVSNWKGTPKQLAARVIAAAKIVHATAPKAVVVSPAMVLRMRYQRTFMDKFFGAKVHGRRVGRFLDAVGVDPYPQESGTPEDSMTLLGKARSILRAHHVDAPLWNVEINYGVAGDGQPISDHSSGTRQASYVVRTYVLNAAANVKRVYWLGWGTYDTLDVALATSAGSPTKAGTAYQVVASWLLQQKSRGCVNDEKEHLYSCRLLRDGRTSWVFWTTKGKTVVRAPKGSRHVASMTGDVAGTHAGKRLTVNGAPILVYH